MTSAEIEQAVHEAYAMAYILWNAGIDPDHVFHGTERFANSPAFPGAVHVSVVARRDDKSFTMRGAFLPSKADEQRFNEAWMGFVKRQPSLSKERKDLIVAMSGVLDYESVIVDGLRAKGLIE